MRFIILILTLAFFFSLFGTEDVKIGIFAKYNLTELEIDIAQSARIFYLGKDKTLNKGKWTVSLKAGIICFSNKGVEFRAEHILLQSKGSFTITAILDTKVTPRIYEGNLELYGKEKKILLVLTFPLENYVSSATYSELGELLFDKSMTEKSKTQLIAAQEIVIRTYITKEKRRHGKEVYSFCDLTHCIHFAGAMGKLSIHPEIILSGNNPVNGYFHSTCGGRLTGPEVFWSKDEISRHYRRGNDGDESHCKDSPHFVWDTILSTSDLEEILLEKNLIAFKTETKDGRVTRLQYTNSDQRQKVISIAAFSTKVGKIHGWNKIKSNYFIIAKIGDNYRFRGHGLGHGIGLCQWGAKNLAANDKSFAEILEFYFPGTELKKL